MQSVTIRCEYIWPSVERKGQLHSKTRVIDFKSEDPANWNISLDDIPAWSFDGSKIGYSTAEDYQLLLRPIFASIDPNRKNSILVLCDVLNTDFTPHILNYRSQLIDTVLKTHDQIPLIGFGQEFRIRTPSSTMTNVTEYFHSQVGCRPSEHREIVESHLNSCISTGISIDSSSSEGSEDKWQYQIGGPKLNAVQTCDQLLVSRFLLMRITENFRGRIEYHRDDSLNITISTQEMREAKDSSLVFSLAKKICSISYKLTASTVYGAIEDNLTPDRFSCTSSDVEVRIPWSVQTMGSGYLEDTRPASGSDPYLTVKALIDTVCGE